MANLYIALNGDDVGTTIGEAIASDDHESLSATSSAIEGAHGNIDEWIESVGGKKITRSGDEGIYLIPENALSDLESIKNAYSEQSGHGLTVGVGSSMSEASKALIYGKLNGKNQIVHYDPMIEDYLSDEDTEEEMPEDFDQEIQEDDDQEQAEEESEDEDSEMSGKKPSPKTMEADGNLDEADGEDDFDDEEQSEEQGEDEDFAPGEDQGDDHQKTSDAPPNKTLDEEYDEDDDESEVEDEDEESSIEDQTMDSDTPGARAIDGDIDGEDFGSDKDNSEEEDQSEEMASKESMESQQQPESDSQEESAYAELNEKDMSNPEMELDNESYDHNDALSDMIHGDLEDEEQGEEPPGAIEEEVSESQLDEELRQDIASALMSFKENKDMLEQAREQNPKLYQATITMLRSMIEMAKKLGANPAQDMEDAENDQQLVEQFPAAEEGKQKAPPGVPPVRPDTGGESSEKKIAGRLR